MFNNRRKISQDLMPFFMDGMRATDLAIAADIRYGIAAAWCLQAADQGLIHPITENGNSHGKQYAAGPSPETKLRERHFIPYKPPAQKIIPVRSGNRPAPDCSIGGQMFWMA